MHSLIIMLALKSSQTQWPKAEPPGNCRKGLFKSSKAANKTCEKNRQQEKKKKKKKGRNIVQHEASD